MVLLTIIIWTIRMLVGWVRGLIIMRWLYWIVLIPSARLDKIIIRNSDNKQANKVNNLKPQQTRTPPQPSPSLIYNFSNKNFTNSTNPTLTTTPPPHLQTHNPPMTHKNHLPKWTHDEQCYCRMTFMATIITQLSSTNFLNSSAKSCNRRQKRSHIYKVLSSDNLSSSNFSKKPKLNESNKSSTRM